jgi:hypothetical protein
MAKDSKKPALRIVQPVPTLTPREIFETSEWERIKTFIRTNRDQDTPYPIPGPTLNFRSDNGKIMMQLDVKDKPSFTEAVKKNAQILNRWRSRLTAFDRRPRWESLPHPAPVIIARSKKGRDCLEWLKSSDPGLADLLSTERGNGLTYGQLSKEMNKTIEAWLTDFAARSKTAKSSIGFSDSVGVLMVAGFSRDEEEAVYECKNLLAAIQRGENPFNVGRAKYCRPITREMIRKRITSWTA